MLSCRCCQLSQGDHPREYGENAGIAAVVGALVGSSPRIRGEWFRGRYGHALGGIIPANTGRIHCMRSSRLNNWDHPREYGENCAHALALGLCGGSSPRIRGECCLVRRCLCGVGIIPANTGRICLFLACVVHSWDHPREYGENKAVTCRFTMSMGSSPRIRGEYLLT